ncbi:MAG TPA: response regulator [Chitinophagaceae bacterium]|nr:response regulator [Chitinophagaceae bacterium]
MPKILIIDDDRDLCTLLNRYLTENGFDVTEIYHGGEAIRWVEQNRPDLVLCDLRLEDMDGIDVLKRIKERYISLPVIMITAYSDIRTSVNAMRTGALDYLTKPLQPAEILRSIREALEETEKSSPVPNESGRTLKAAGIDAEYEMIVETLKKVNFNKSKAARLLHIDRKTLYNKMSQYRELKNQ